MPTLNSHQKASAFDAQNSRVINYEVGEMQELREIVDFFAQKNGV
jgi:hypothetical protein